LAETGRRARNILENPSATALSAWPVHARIEDLDNAVRALEAAGAPAPGRLAALLDLEPEAIALAAEALATGTPAATVEAAISGAAVPGAALAQIAHGSMDPQRVAIFDATPPVLRAFALDLRVVKARAERGAAQKTVACFWLDRFEQADAEAPGAAEPEV